jgi:hypothetical protein
MTFLRWAAAAALIGSATACVGNNTPYGGGNGYAYSPGAYDYNQQPTYYGTHYANGQPTYGSRQPSYYGYGYQPQPVYYGYQQPAYYGR